MQSPTKTVEELSAQITARTAHHDQWRQTVAVHWDGIIHSLSSHIESLTQELLVLQHHRTHYERELFTEPIAEWSEQRRAQIATARCEYRACVRDFIPHRTQLSIAVRDLVPAVCAVFHTRDTHAVVPMSNRQQDQDGNDDGDSEGLRMPWDVMGGVIATLFASVIPTVTMTTEEYIDQSKKQQGLHYSDQESAYTGHCIRLKGSVADHYDGYLPPLWSGSGITLDVSDVEGLSYCSACTLPRESSWRATNAITAVSFGSALQHIKETPNLFLCDFIRLEKCQIDVGGLPNATRIGDQFLCKTLLQEIDLRPFRNVTSIGGWFLSESAVPEVDLSPLSNVTEISAGFFRGCQHLKTIDLTPLRNLKTVHVDSWFNSCRRLSGTIDLTPLRSAEVANKTSCFLHLANKHADAEVLVPAENERLVDFATKSMENYRERYREHHSDYDSDNVSDLASDDDENQYSMGWLRIHIYRDRIKLKILERFLMEKYIASSRKRSRS